MEKEKNIMPDYVTKYDFEKEKNTIYAHINKKTDENKKSIDEIKRDLNTIDDKHTKENMEIRRELDRNTFQIESLNENIPELNSTIKELSKTFSGFREDFIHVNNRLSRAEEGISIQKTAEEKKKEEMLKFFGILIPSLIGGTGLISWLGPMVIDLLSFLAK